MKKSVLKSAKQVIVGIVLTGLIALVPFYFEAKQTTENNMVVNSKQEAMITQLEKKSAELEKAVAVEQAERKHNKEALQRIERKLDELIREVKSLEK